MSITSVAFFRAVPGCEPTLAALLGDLVQVSLRDRGCLGYVAHQSLDTPKLWFVYSSWRSERDLEAHLHTEHVARFARAAATQISGELEMGLFSPASIHNEERHHA